MRKSLIAFILAVVLCAAGICHAGAAINAQRDRVQVRERVLYGDKSVIEGVKVGYRVHNARQLFWDITYHAGEEPRVDAEYAYYAKEQEIPYAVTHNGVGLDNYVESDLNYMDSPESLTGLAIAYRELYDSTGPGEEREATVRLGDYYEFYPIGADIDLPGIRESWSAGFSYDAPPGEANLDIQNILAFQDFFKIPVLEDHYQDISLAKNANGDLHSMGGGTSDKGDRFYFSTLNAVTDGACYFTFLPHSQDGKLVDASHIPGGYGIYRLPYGEGYFAADQLEMVYPLDPSVQLEGLYTDPTQTELLLFTVEDMTGVLTVIDVATMEQAQRLEFTREDSSFSIWNVTINEGYICLTITGDNRYAVLTKGDEGYVTEFVADVANDALPDFYLTAANQGTDWDGEKLILCSRWDDRDEQPYKSSSFRLAAYDETGLIYAGEYKCGLDTGRNPSDYDYYCFFMEHQDFEVSWAG